MAKANKKAAAKKAAPKKAAAKKTMKAAAPKKAAPKKGMKAAAPKKAAPKKGMKAIAPKKAAPKKGMKAVAPKKAAPKKGMKSAKAAAPKKVAVKKSAPSSDQRPMLEALFIDHLKDIYWAEKYLTRAMPKMKKAATSPDLQQVFDQHLQVTMNQIARLEQVFESLGKKATGKKCDAMTGLIMEAESVISETEKGSSTRDVGLIISAQKVEHYEIASYGGLATLAQVLGLAEAKNLLGATLEEEKQADAMLTEIAEGHINRQAEQEGGEEETETDEDEDGASEEAIETDEDEDEDSEG